MVIPMFVDVCLSSSFLFVQVTQSSQYSLPFGYNSSFSFYCVAFEFCEGEISACHYLWQWESGVFTDVRGGTQYAITSVISSPFQLAYQQKVSISLQICQGLVFMHSAAPPIAHLDLKPENVLVSHPYCVHVLWENPLVHYVDLPLHMLLLGWGPHPSCLSSWLWFGKDHECHTYIWNSNCACWDSRVSIARATQRRRAGNMLWCFCNGWSTHRAVWQATPLV